MGISTETVKELRDETGISVMQCKKALEEADGDVAKARAILAKKGGEVAAKKADRELGAGAVAAYVHASGDIGAMILLSCETDFVSKNEEFAALARDIAMHVTAMRPAYISRADVSEEDMNTARELFANDVTDKPEELQGKILEGKLDAYFAERVLLEQPFIKEQDITIRGLIDRAVQKFGERIEVADMSLLSAR